VSPSTQDDAAALRDERKRRQRSATCRRNARLCPAGSLKPSDRAELATAVIDQRSRTPLAPPHSAISWPTCVPPAPADRLSGAVLGQVGYWAASRLQHDAALTHPLERLHNRRLNTPARLALSPPACTESPSSDLRRAVSFRAITHERFCAGRGGSDRLRYSLRKRRMGAKRLS
jgi:hypothetical protein